MVTGISRQPVGPIFKDQQSNKIASNRWMCCYSFLFSSLLVWGLLHSAIGFLPLLSLLPSKCSNFFPLLYWPCLIFRFSIALCALKALIPFLLHSSYMFPGSFASPMFDMFICLLRLTSLLCLSSSSLLIFWLFPSSSLPSWWPLHAPATWLPSLPQWPVHCPHHPLHNSTATFFQHCGLLDALRWDRQSTPKKKECLNFTEAEAGNFAYSIPLWYLCIVNLCGNNVSVKF